jgi:hypothetical protein
VAVGDVLLHGSSNRDIQHFQPRPQTTYGGAPTTAVFGTPDPVWATFFAVTDFARATSRWNACLLPEETGLDRPRYFFSVGARPDDVWTQGAVYVLPRSAFVQGESPSEWHASASVTPLDVVAVSPDDFPFRRQVFRHDVSDTAWRRLLRLWSASVRPHG